MTAKPVQFVLEELGAVADAQPAAHPLRRTDRDNSQVYETGESIDTGMSLTERTRRLEAANFVGAGTADRSATYIGTKPNLDLESVVGVRIEGYSGYEGHVDPDGNDGVVFHGTDDSLVEQIRSTLYDTLSYPDAGRTNVTFTHLSIDGTPAVTDLAEHYRYDLDIRFDGFETL